MKKGAYVQFPRTVVKNSGENVCQGFAEIVSCLKEACNQKVKTILTVECYPGVNQQELLEGLQSLGAVLTIHSDDLAFEPEKIDALLEKETDAAARKALRQEANRAVADMVKKELAGTLDKVLYELSGQMKNAYSRSDA